MHTRRLFWQLYFSYLLVILVALLVVAIFASHSVRHFHLDERIQDLESRALLVRGHFADCLEESASAQVDSLCKLLGRASSTRITVVLADGRVIGDTEEDPSVMERHTGGSRPEIARAMGNEVGSSLRFSPTLRRSMLYVAVPVLGERDGRQRVAGVVRTALPLTAIREVLRTVYLRLAGGALAIALLLGAVSFWLARRISQPLELLRRGAEAYARGELDRQLPMPSLEEFRSLTGSMNRMAADLRDRLETITHQRNELEAILLSMVEGILAVDSRREIVSLNAACARMLQIDPDRARGKRIEEVVRNPALQSLIDRAISSAGAAEADIVLHGEGRRYLQVHSSVVRNPDGRESGVVFVLNDVTRLRHLEAMRRDFVANVSHELKTPITAIRGAVETLQDGAIEDRADTDRFLFMLARQADRLQAIVEDLLALSRIEEQSGRAEIQFTVGPLEPILAGAIQSCESQANEQGISLGLSCYPQLQARINPPLLENAVVNLIDNAIKHSEPGGHVTVVAAAEGQGVVIQVADKGCGIDQALHGRIFERFFRVDRARSRSMGGTGLGLAIVKHIALAHGGEVSLESVPGQGSTFRISLPGS